MIDVAGFAASTLNISDADFISGRMRFQGTGAEGKVTNAGTIRTAEGGHVYLIAPNVENQASGVITSPNGEVVIAAGKTVELVNSRTPDLRVEFAAPDNQAVNAGEIVAASGSVGIYGTPDQELRPHLRRVLRWSRDGRVFLALERRAGDARGARSLAAGSVRLQASQELTLDTGSRISADAPIAGEVVLVSAGDLTLKASSSITANGVEGGAVLAQAAGTVYAQGVVEAKGSDGGGGSVRLLGDRVAILQAHCLDASGERGGREVPGWRRLPRQEPGRAELVDNVRRPRCGDPGPRRRERGRRQGHRLG